MKMVADHGIGRVHVVMLSQSERLAPADARKIAFELLLAAAQLDGDHPRVEAGVADGDGIVEQPFAAVSLPAMAFTHYRRVWCEPWQPIP